MMPRPKGPKTTVERIRLPEATLEELDQEIAESGDEYASRAQLIRHILHKHLKARKERKRR